MGNQAEGGDGLRLVVSKEYFLHILVITGIYIILTLSL